MRAAKTPVRQVKFAHLIHCCMLAGLNTIMRHPLSVMAEGAFRNLVQSKLIDEHPEIELEEASHTAGMATFISKRAGRLQTRLAAPTGNRLQNGQSADIRLLAGSRECSFEVKCRESFGSNANLSGALAGDIFRIERSEVDGVLLAASRSEYQKLCRSPLTPGVKGRAPTYFYSDILPSSGLMDERIRRFSRRHWQGADYVSVGAIVKCPNEGEDHVLLCITLFAYLEDVVFPAWLETT